MGSDLEIKFARLDPREKPPVRVAINTDEALWGELAEILNNDHKMQVILYPRETVWANTTANKQGKEVVITVDISNKKYDTCVMPNVTNDFTEVIVEELNAELDKLQGSKAIQGKERIQSVTSHGKQKKGTCLFH